MSAPVELSSAEQQAYDLIVTEGEMYQSELWKALDIGSRKGSRIAQALAANNLIKRERTVHDGRVTYLLTPTKTGPITTTTASPESTEVEATESEETIGDLTQRDQRALALIRRTGGIHQSELWKELNVSSRTGTRIAKRLAEDDLIERDETVYKGRITYMLTPSQQEVDFSLLMAGDMISPFVGADEVDPQNEAFTEWLLKLSRDTTD